MGSINIDARRARTLVEYGDTAQRVYRHIVAGSDVVYAGKIVGRVTACVSTLGATEWLMCVERINGPIFCPELRWS